MKVWLFLIGLFLILPTGSVLAADAKAVDPSEDLRCWTTEVCATSDGRFDNSSDTAKKACGGSYGFCYPPAMEYELGVSLPVAGRITTSVTDLGDYIDKAYKFLLGFSVIFAVLMLMVGGLQYVTSPGGEEISKAKERITRSLTGLVLLMCAALILFTVNPHLINLEMPAIPKTRTVFFVSDSTTCELLFDKGYTLKNSSGEELKNDGSSVASGKCGDTIMTVVKDPSDMPLKEKTCHWSTCLEKEAFCLTAPKKGDKDWCLKCENISDGNEFGITVSSSTCSRLTPEDTANIDYRCFASNDSALDITGTSCALLKIECNSITKCEDYESMKVVSSGVSSDNLEDIQSGTGSDLGLESICKEDPCKSQRIDGGTCEFKKTPGVVTLASDDCETK